MSGSFTPAELVQQLQQRDPRAPWHLANAYYWELNRWLRQCFPRVDEDFCFQAAAQAIEALAARPSTYDPSKLPLDAYLRMSARRDLLNLIEREQRHQRRKKSLETVEVSPDVRNYLGVEDDPIDALIRAEEMDTLQSIVAVAREGLSEQERRCFELNLDGERRTEPYAQAMSWQTLSQEEQQRRVKQLKDKFIKRLQRARERRDE